MWSNGFILSIAHWFSILIPTKLYQTLRRIYRRTNPSLFQPHWKPWCMLWKSLETTSSLPYHPSLVQPHSCIAHAQVMAKFSHLQTRTAVMAAPTLQPRQRLTRTSPLNRKGKWRPQSEKQQSTSNGSVKGKQWLARECQQPHDHDGGWRQTTRACDGLFSWVYLPTYGKSR